MDMDRVLENLQIGEADLESVRGALAHILGKKLGTLQQANDVANALEGWTWRTLQARRHDKELHDWVRLLGSAAARIGQFDQVSGAAVEAYARLVRRSANTARRVDTANLLRRKHVRSVLDILLKANGPTSRSALLSQLALKEANLTRIVAPLLDLALVEREVNGREAAYRLTERGRVLVANRDTADYVDRLRVAQEFPLTRTCMVKPANSKSEGEAPNWTLQERQKVKTTVTKDAPYQSFANSRRHLVTEQRTVEA